MPKGTKRKREDEEDPQPRRSQRERKRTSFGEDFVWLFSPPKNPASTKGSSQSGPSSQSAPSTSSAGGAGVEPEVPANTVTWASSPNKWKQPLPTNHRKWLYFLHKRSHGFSKCLSSALHKVSTCISTVWWCNSGKRHQRPCILVSDNWYLVSDSFISSSWFVW